MNLRILSYNIHGGTGLDRVHDYKRINRLLLDQKIDIALLQEVDTRPSKKGTPRDIADLRGEYPEFIEGVTIRARHGWYGNAILSRFPALESRTIDISVSGREPRNIVEAIFDTPSGPLRILNTHKGLKHGERQQQFKKLHHLLDRHLGVPLMIGGDMNEWGTSSRALRDLNSALRSVIAGRTFPSFWPIFQLDRVWCRPDALVKDAWVLKTPETRKYSDHLPVMAELNLALDPGTIVTS